jgi:hypothetical protein
MGGRIAVSPPLLESAGGHARRIAEQVNGERERLNSAASQVTGATGSNAAEAAFGELRSAADRSLAALVGDTGGLGTQLFGASNAYATTDRTAFPER